MRMKQPVRAKKPAHKKGSPRFTRALGTPAMIALVFCVMGAAILLAVSRPSPDVVASAAPSHQSATDDGRENRPAVPAASGTPRAEYGAPRNLPDADAAAPAASARKAAPVTITGCLEQDDETFRLKNAMGQDAPKARSWKSGFLKRGPAPIDVIDASHRLKLPTHVGQRVSVTGVLVGREMQVGSLRSVAASCNQKS
jgi:hypothetical protein